jgi:carboxypeptidase-like protein/TonB-dependent receptor-like protein
MLLKKLVFIIIFFSGVNLLAADGYVFSGKVFNSVTGKPVELATVIVLEARVKGYTDQNGSFSLKIKDTGTYSLIIKSSGLKMIKTKMTISNNYKRNFKLRPLSIKGGGITITGKRDIQKVSRRTMTAKEMKETPASFGDSISAMTSLPGVERTNGFFGPLVIRGIGPDKNRYFVDGIPINNPMHFGGLHSVINSNMMSEIDLFSSSSPSQYGGVTGAVININTVDDVKEFGGYTDIGIISASTLFQAPIKRGENGDVFFVGPYTGEVKSTNAGYIMASARIGYLSFIVPYIVEIITGDKPFKLPEYWDYQFKGKFHFNSRNSLTILMNGSSDYWKIVVDDEMNDEEGADPLVTDIKFNYDQIFHNQGLVYKYERDKFKNTLSMYSALSEHYMYINAGNENAAVWAKDYSLSVKPNIFGFKEEFVFEWIKKIANLKGNIEYTLYDFKADGKELLPNTPGEDGFDLANPDAIISKNVNTEFRNHVISGYLENKFKYKGLTFVPGIRIDHLKRTNQTTKDLRGLISYELPSDTTLSISSGQYSSFFQVNTNYFQGNPSLGELDEGIKPEKAWHNVIGLEQAFDMYVISIEYFNNKFYDHAVAYPHPDENGDLIDGLSSAEYKTSGIEIMIRKDNRQGTNGLFGWLSYTYTQSKMKSGILGNMYDQDGNDLGVLYDLNGDKWLNSDYEQEHSCKLVLGYRLNAHTFSGRFQYYTSMPYTPIVGGTGDILLDGTTRYAPVYSTDLNSERFKPDYRLDLRYSYQTNHKWGYIRWYVEVINATNNEEENILSWKYDRAYGSDNPEITKEEGLTIIPNFGVEVKF